MNFSKSNANAKQAVIRKTVVNIPVRPTQRTGTPQHGSARPRDPDRFKLSDKTTSGSAVSKKPPKPVQRALSVVRGVKRKSVTPQPALFSSDDEDVSSDIGGSDSDVSRKRLKSSVSSLESNVPKRVIVSEQAFLDDAEFDFVHGADATSGGHGAKFKSPWDEDGFETTALQYPTKSQQERFELKWPKNEKEDYKPMEDIIETIKTVCTFYLPDELSERYTDDSSGFGRRFNRAWQRQSIEEFVETLEDYSSVVKTLVNNGTVRTELLSRSTLHLDWVKRILEQTYARTVSPDVDTLKAYKNGTDFVYGELLARFVSEIFQKTKLNHEQVFVDLGSGVGNVVLQAALEAGCESWGIEYMDAPCRLAKLQAQEFPARARLWGVSVGSVHLIQGDFTNNPQISEVLKRADVVLVNNQAFTPALNDKLRDMFLDLKEGCQVASLKPFVPAGHKLTTRNYGSVVNHFVQRRFEYFSNSVSWTDAGGYYYIANVDRKPLQSFMRAHNLR